MPEESVRDQQAAPSRDDIVNDTNALLRTMTPTVNRILAHTAPALIQCQDGVTIGNASVREYAYSLMTLQSVYS
jgi:hypothetical protein